MDYKERQAEARARFAATDTAVLERMWIRDERVDWAEAALRAELIDRGIDPDALARRHIDEQAVRPAWLKMEAVQVAAPSARPPGAAMPLRWFMAVFAVLVIGSMALIWAASYSSEATAETRKVVLPVFGAIAGSSVLLRWLRVDFRYVFSGLWATGLCAATVVFLCLPHAAPTASLLDDVNALSKAQLAVGVEQRAVAAASKASADWRLARANLRAHMIASERATVVGDVQLADLATRDRVRDALRNWRSDLAAQDMVDDRARRGLGDAEASVIAEGGRPAASITRDMADLTMFLKRVAPIRAATIEAIDAREAVVDFFETHPVQIDQARNQPFFGEDAKPEYARLLERRKLALQDEARSWATVLAQQGQAPQTSR
jgi:hypothetical protein